MEDYARDNVGDNKKCEYVNPKTEKRCNAYKRMNSKYCFTHSDDPKFIAEREQALIKAGDSKKLYLPVEEGKEVSLNLPKFVDLSRAKGIKKAYITIIRAAAQGVIAERRLGALTYALNGYVNAIDKIGLLERIEKLEKIAKQKGTLNGY